MFRFKSIKVSMPLPTGRHWKLKTLRRYLRIKLIVILGLFYLMPIGGYIVAKKDDNHNTIVKVLKSLGYEVMDLSGLGKGAPDILISDGPPALDMGHECTQFEKRMWLVEIKMPGKKLTKDEKKFHEKWQGKPIITADSIGSLLRQLI